MAFMNKTILLVLLGVALIAPFVVYFIEFGLGYEIPIVKLLNLEHHLIQKFPSWAALNNDDQILNLHEKPFHEELLDHLNSLQGFELDSVKEHYDKLFEQYETAKSSVSTWFNSKLNSDFFNIDSTENSDEGYFNVLINSGINWGKSMIKVNMPEKIPMSKIMLSPLYLVCVMGVIGILYLISFGYQAFKENTQNHCFTEMYERICRLDQRQSENSCCQTRWISEFDLRVLKVMGYSFNYQKKSKEQSQCGDTTCYICLQEMSLQSPNVYQYLCGRHSAHHECLKTFLKKICADEKQMMLCPVRCNSIRLEKSQSELLEKLKIPFAEEK